jgi:hypothetical protein
VGIRTMAIDLSTLTFTNQADIVPSSGTDRIINTGTANTRGGDDSISGTGTGTTGPGFQNRGFIWCGDGNDSISGTTNNYAGTANYGSIWAGDGNDSISGTGYYGIYNGGSIRGGDGNDSISGTGDFSGIFNNFGGSIWCGNGNDSISGTGSYGILNDTVNESGIWGGDGSDSITGAGTTVGIQGGTINGGLGDDFFKARRIDTAGNPLAITQQGGAVSSVLINGGAGADTFDVGWGNATLNGGNGCDKLILLGTSSDYTITGTNLNRTITRAQIGQGILVMSVLNVENIAYTTVV